MKWCLWTRVASLLASSLYVAALGCGGAAATAGGGISIPPTTVGDWTWMGGSNAANAVGVYGTLGTAAPTNVPGSRGYAGGGWTDKSGNLWLMGGLGFDSANNQGNLNDLWEFSPASNQWTWMSGSPTLGTGICGSLLGRAGVYGTVGVPATSNVPGARQIPSGWVDSSGNVWLFGGYGCGSSAGGGTLNDLWEFNPSAKTWTWIGGSSAPNAAGVYGTQGLAVATNVPASRYLATSWEDNGGNFWLFGGGTGVGGSAPLNDLWEFNPSAKTWTWVSGSSTANAVGVYGALGVAATANVPGSRTGAVSWADGSGNFWLFGGTSGGVPQNDLWEFSPSGKTWTWISGSNTGNAFGVYGTKGVASNANVPGSRSSAVSWIDGGGNLWLFGGNAASFDFNDLWKFNLVSKEWTWMGGGNSASNAIGIYGTQGTASSANFPGGREGAVGWADATGDLWLFGGQVVNPPLNDLWRYQPQ
jgi:hypothetical protein